MQFYDYAGFWVRVFECIGSRDQWNMNSYFIWNNGTITINDWPIFIFFFSFLPLFIIVCWVRTQHLFTITLYIPMTYFVIAGCECLLWHSVCPSFSIWKQNETNRNNVCMIVRCTIQCIFVAGDGYFFYFFFILFISIQPLCYNYFASTRNIVILFFIFVQSINWYTTHNTASGFRALYYVYELDRQFVTKRNQ